MFITKEKLAAGPRPASSAIAPGDLSILQRYWYPVAVAGDVADAPLAAKLLDVDLVVYKSDDRIAVALDVCPHRSVKMSAGRMIDDRLVCRYHGMRFDSAGRCTRIPAVGEASRFPASYNLAMVRSEVRYGLVWACLDAESTERVPDIAGLIEAGDDRLAYAEPQDWPASAARQIENTIDLAHIPFVHENSMGVDVPVPTDGKMTHTDDGIIYTGVVRERRMDDGTISRVDMNYIVTLPFVLELTSHVLPENMRRLHMIDIPVPITAYRCRLFIVFVVPEGYTPPKQSQPNQGEGAQILSEDIEILGHLALQDVPLDRIAEKIDIPGDRFAVEYRRRLHALGLGRG